MPIYKYQAEKGGQVFSGQIKAPSVQVVHRHLKVKNMDPIYVVEKSILPFKGGMKKVKNKDLMHVTRQLAFLLGSGVSLVEALSMIIEVADISLYFKNSLKQIRKKIESGSGFSRALKGFPGIFSEFYVNMILCAEETGLLEQVLLDLANYMEKIEHIKSKVRAPMMYIGIVLFIALSITVGLIIFVVPTFQQLYSGSGGQLPGLTQMLVELSEAMRSKWYLFLGGVVAVPFALIKFLETDQGKDFLSGFLVTLPLVGKLQYKGDLARFCRAFETLLRSGVNFMESLEVGLLLAKTKQLKYGLKVARKSVSKGKSFADGLSGSKVFPPMMVGMTRIGEESGKLHYTYTKLADFYEREVDDMVSSLVKMIEPLMITVVGGLIGILILALYMPIFNMGDMF